MNIGILKKTSYMIIAGIFFLVMQYGCSGPSLKPYASDDLVEFAQQENKNNISGTALMTGGKEVIMAVLPFDNLSETQGVGKKMESFILVEFLRSTPLKIIEPGELKAALSEERIRLATSIPKETVRKLGRKLGVNLFIIGTVLEYNLQLASGAAGRGEVPVVAVTLRVIDAETGDILWAVNAARRGTDRETIFGKGRVYSSDKLAQNIASEIAEAFAASLKK